MNNFEFFGGNSTPYLGLILIILSVIPWILTYTIFKPKYVRISLKSEDKIYKIHDIVSIILYVIVGILFITNKKDFDLKNANGFFVIMGFCYFLYYELYIRYILRGKAQKELYNPFCYIKAPIFLTGVLALVFAGIWSSNIVLILATIILGVNTYYNAYKKYINYFTEYRDLYDENRKSTGRKMLKDGFQPRKLKYVAVAVFIYNPKNRKWLMQKRSIDKGGKWATTTGHPISGQSSSQGMIREIKEEIGLDVEENELQFLTTIKREKKFVDIYYLEKSFDINDLVLQKEEVDDVMWMTSKEVKAFYSRNMYKKTHYKYYEEMTKYVNNR